MRQITLLLVDDDPQVLDSMSGWLREQGHQVWEARGVQEALGVVEAQPLDLVLCDIQLEDGDGFRLLEHCRSRRPELGVILVTGYGTVDTGIEAIRAGAFDLLTKPLMDDELTLAIDRVMSQRKVLEENRHLRQQLDQRFGMENIVGQDARMRKVFEAIECVADTKATVLITGESGTGKSLIARAIHRHSSRSDGPFVELACGALPETLLETELFGHVAGAFTGAQGERHGKFMQSEGGTIFLDEISTASPSMQVKLLRVLQDFEFEQVGGAKTYRVNTRVILATNENLEEAVASGRFRQDLYYRVNVINIQIPPLRERPADISVLAHHFLDIMAGEVNRKVVGFSTEALDALHGYRWPGNVRELQNVIERAVLLGKADRVGCDDLPTHVLASSPSAAPRSLGRTLKEALEGPERQIILDVLKSNNWNRNVTADTLGINRTTLYKKMKRLGLEREGV